MPGTEGVLTSCVLDLCLERGVNDFCGENGTLPHEKQRNAVEGPLWVCGLLVNMHTCLSRLTSP